jgi:hypothetical protein
LLAADYTPVRLRAFGRIFTDRNQVITAKDFFVKLRFFVAWCQKFVLASHFASQHLQA